MNTINFFKRRVLGEAFGATFIAEGRSLFKKHGVLVTSNNMQGDVLNKITKSNHPLDITWFPAAAAEYKLSKDLNDYVFVDTTIITADFSNRNWYTFPLETLVKFDVDLARMRYQTFRGKPLYKDHNWEGAPHAKGVHFDIGMHKAFVAGDNKPVWIVREFIGFDRTKDSYLCNAIINGERFGYSMGGLVNTLRCPVCNLVTNMLEKHPRFCHHERGVIYDGILCSLFIDDILFVESSSVRNPADVWAFSPPIILK